MKFARLKWDERGALMLESKPGRFEEIEISLERNVFPKIDPMYQFSVRMAC